MSVVVLIVPILCATVVPEAEQQQDRAPELQLRTEANYIALDAYVTDKSGHPVTDLTARDFELFEDGARQQITVFRRVEFPLPRRVASMPAGKTTATEPASDDAQDASTGRTYLIVLDDLHISQAYASRVKSALNQFIDRAVGAGDIAAVLYTSGRRNDSQDFTSSAGPLRAAVDKLAGRKLRSPTVERLQDHRLNTSGVVASNADPFETERAHRAQTTLAMLRELGVRMGDSAGTRKTMLFVSEGVEYEVGMPRPSRASQWSVNADLGRAVSALNRSNVTVYSLDPRGVATGSEGLIESSSIFEPQGVGSRSARREMQLSHGFLQALSANTGGTALLWRNDLGPGFDGIVREASSYYLLGYRAPARNGTAYRRIELRVTRPGATVRTRDGYFPDRP